MKILLLSLTAVAGLFAQAPLEFEAASVKPAAPPTDQAVAMIGLMRGGPGTRWPGEITYLNNSLRRLIVAAYQVKEYEVTMPGWMDNVKFDIVAKVPHGATREQFQIMLQNLLVTRLGLTFHKETHDQLAYELSVAKGGLKMKEAAPAAGEAPAPDPVASDGGGRRGAIRTETDRDGLMQLAPGRAGRGQFILGENRIRISARMQTAGDIAKMCTLRIGVPVVDKTGMTGKYDFNLDFARDVLEPATAEAGVPHADEPAPAFINAVQQQLGLRLEKKKTSQEVMVVDKAERVPKEQ